MISRIFTLRTDWRGITVEVSYEPGFSPAMSRAYGQDMRHLQIRSVSPARCALPISETGYRSHFVATEEIADAGGLVAYARAWLDHEAGAPAWRREQESARQLLLFCPPQPRRPGPGRRGNAVRRTAGK